MEKIAQDNIVIEFKDINKFYPGVQALKGVNFALEKGEIHALVGENGAGKSTLIKTCSGAIEPTSGTICVNGQQFERLTPILSRENGIAVIYQELNLINELSVWENIFLGKAIRKGIIIDKQAMRKRSIDLFKQLDCHIDPDALVKNLSMGFQQVVEIAKALSEDAQILILDEPTAALTNAETEALMKIIKKLQNVGVSMIYITHRLDEVFRIADRTTVLRDGEFVATLDTKNSTRDQLVQLMVGRELKETFPQRTLELGKDVFLSINNLTGNGLKNVSLKVYKGEILGLGGLIGAGRTELAEILFGCAKATKGEIYLNNKRIHSHNQREAISHGIALVPEDRKRQGVLLHMSVKENISIPILRKISKLSVISKKKENIVIDNYIKSLRIKTPNANQKVKNLSGGNQQKIVLAKWLAANPDLIIFDEPTRGIDVGAKHEIYVIMHDLIMQGKTLIVISSDMEELMGISDRIVVLAEGKITGELKNEEFNQETILRYASEV